MTVITPNKNAEKAKAIGRDIIRKIDSEDKSLEAIAHHLYLSGNPEWKGVNEKTIYEYLSTNIGRGNIFTRINRHMDVQTNQYRFAGVLEAAGYETPEREDMFLRVQEIRPENKIFTYVSAGVKPHKPMK